MGSKDSNIRENNRKHRSNLKIKPSDIPGNFGINFRSLVFSSRSLHLSIKKYLKRESRFDVKTGRVLSVSSKFLIRQQYIGKTKEFRKQGTSRQLHALKC